MLNRTVAIASAARRGLLDVISCAVTRPVNVVNTRGRRAAGVAHGRLSLSCRDDRLERAVLAAVGTAAGAKTKWGDANPNPNPGWDKYYAGNCDELVRCT